MTEHFIGLMSGTSLDGVDGVVVRWDAEAKPVVVAAGNRSFPVPLRQTLLALNRPGHDELATAAVASQQLVECYASVCLELIDRSGLASSDIRAIGAHGQTVRHRPPGTIDAHPYTIQLNHPALLAELTGVTVVADFRSRDMAAGGQGAPLVPAFHREVFHQPGQSVAVVNIGGMANVTILPAEGPTSGHDTGPGNVLLDLWCHRHTGHWMDENGAWAATGHIHEPLLNQLLGDAYFRQRGAKSTGRDVFHADWLDARLSATPNLPAQDVQATLTALTAHTIAAAVQQAEWGTSAPSRLWVCGGGSRNQTLMAMLQQALPELEVRASDDAGWPAHWVEAAAFGWLAREVLSGRPANLPAVTGARGPRMLGAIYPA